MESVRIIEIPECKMVSSGIGMFGDGTLEKFAEQHLSKGFPLLGQFLRRKAGLSLALFV